MGKAFTARIGPSHGAVGDKFPCFLRRNWKILRTCCVQDTEQAISLLQNVLGRSSAQFSS